ncbi:diguanylate cyclase [Gammaproteobacteria bacterium]
MPSITEPSISEIQDILEELEQAIQDHNQWLMEWHRAIICRVPLEEHHMANDAHRCCNFGRWYYGHNHSYLATFPAFAQLELVHLTIHAVAKNLLLKSIGNEPLSLVEYDGFLTWRGEFRDVIRTLETKLQQTIFYTDPLTRVANRQQMLPALRQCQVRLSSHQEDSVICMLDLDHFKQVNDHYGHQAGDQVLIAVADFLSGHLRPRDMIFRYGGEEFLLVLVDVNLAVSAKVVERLRTLLAQETIMVDSQTSLRVTASFGLAAVEVVPEVEEIIARADQALYAAKEGGRNQVHYMTSLGIERVSPLDN